MRLFCFILSLASLLAFVGCDPVPSRFAKNTFDPRAAPVDSETEESGEMEGPPEFRTFKPKNSITRGMLRPTKNPYRLGIGDNVEIELLDKPETRQTTQILPDGMVYFDLAEGVPAAGRTVEQLQQAITERMKEFERRPLVRVTLRGITSRKYFALGQINTPGVYPLTRPLTLLDAIFPSRRSGSDGQSGCGEHRQSRGKLHRP